VFVFTRSLVILDNLHGKARVVISVPVPDRAADAEVRSLYDGALAEVEQILARLRAVGRMEPISLDLTAAPVIGKSSYVRADFLSHVDRIKEYIRAGDCFQALLSRRIDIPLDFEPADLYRALRAINPSPYMYHLILDGVEIVGSSPELLVRVSDGHITLRPIAGTRRRGATPAQDDELSAELLADAKERAEHVMLVDLGRNDVGRVAKYGTVKVTELMKVEKYSHVLHIVSQVEGDLNDGLSALDVFRASFPAGTMTGAPKIRAMEIIDELEPVSRGPYAGAIGYIAAGGKRMDLAITIRTCIIADGMASVQAGAGIVADSVPEKEWDETQSKAQALLSAIASVRQVRKRHK
jgi:anthranilate synthase component I